MNAFLFDIDGVLTNPHMTDEVNPQFIALLVAKLNEGYPIGLISGRPLSWEITEVVEKVERYVSEHTEFDPSILDRLFVSGEFGSTAAIHVNGNREEIVYKEKALPKELVQKLEEATKQFHNFGACDPDKLTMFTFYSNGIVPLTVFQEHKEEIMHVIRQVVGDNPAIDIHSDQVSINVKHQSANKHAATAQFLQWLSEKEIKPTHYYAFGDSLSDLEIGKELFDQNLPVTFIFVGEKGTLAHHPIPFSVVLTIRHYDEGTLEFLKEIDR
jgi:hydroxymethylpyrimidine pyrophosphatase-like HAD family hydrolase